MIDKQDVLDFAELVKGFRYEEAHQKYYDPSLVKHENEHAPTIGLEAHRAEMDKFLGSISNYSAEMLQVMVAEDYSAVEWHYKFDHLEWGERDFRELSVQRWKNGKIIHERHHYMEA